MKTNFRPVFLMIIVLSIPGLGSDIPYTVANAPWNEGFGNHRACIRVPQNAEAVCLDFLWRRHDRNPEDKQFIIVHKETGDTVQNIHRLIVDQERCRIVFGPAGKGDYYFYYLPFQVQKAYGFYYGDYLKKEAMPDSTWLKKHVLIMEEDDARLPAAECTEIQSRTFFDSFWPMEVTATGAELTQLLGQTDDDFLLFPEDRMYPIRMRDQIPLRWIEKSITHTFSGEACRNEYYVFQIGVYAARQKLDTLNLVFADLVNVDGFGISSSSLTCFNTEGIDPQGSPFKKYIQIEKGCVQSLWIGVDIPEDIRPGVYKGMVSIEPSNAQPQNMEISLKVINTVLQDRGDSEDWRHSRLRWLNSSAGISTEPVAPYEAIGYSGSDTYELTGKTVTCSRNGLPAEIACGGNRLLSGPVRFILENESGIITLPAGNMVQSEDHTGISKKVIRSSSVDMQFTMRSSLESDGYLNFKITLTPDRDMYVNDIRLEIPLEKEIARYMIGMGLPGCEVPHEHLAPWQGPEDSFWIGDAYAGVWVELRGSSYHGPLLNLYHPEPPVSWHNSGKGGFKIVSDQNQVKAVVYSGDRELGRNRPLDFEFSMLITPVKQVNTRSQFIDRYYHSGGRPVPSEEELNTGVKIVNIHHANPYNPYLNYPFLAVDTLRSLVERFHEKKKDIKLYYTIRELTNHVTEIWALRSLGTEILAGGNGGGYPWLREHLIDHYTPQWYHHFGTDIPLPDATILTATGDSRWYNYYIEGLGWLVENAGIDGVYLDDVAFDRSMLKRMRRVMDDHKPGCLIDLHSNTGFSKGPVKQYAEYFPFIDKLWLGESFLYNEMDAANWFVEVSGIPFGLMGDMLHAGGNPWLGMVYGMTVRYPWMTEGVSCDPRDIWKLWDSFGIDEATMVGYWEKDPVVTVDRDSVFATAYIKKKEMLVAIGNFSDTVKSVHLGIDWEKADLNPEKITAVSPHITLFQEERKWDLNGKIGLEPRKGLLILIRQETD